MKISSYQQYYVRKVLCRYANQFHYPVSGIGLQPCLQLEINSLLKQLYPIESDLYPKIYELEKLIDLHHKASRAILAFPNILQIEQRILWLLGLKFLAILSTLPVPMIPEASGSVFHFVLGNQLYQGIRYADELYGKIVTFEADYNLFACQLIFTLSAQKISFITTVSDIQHGIWVNLRSPLYFTLVSKQPMRQAVA